MKMLAGIFIATERLVLSQKPDDAVTGWTLMGVIIGFAVGYGLISAVDFIFERTRP